MAIGLPVKANYAAGDILTATNMNDLSGTFNNVATSYGNAAGKNKIINGDFGIWQRGTSFNPSPVGFFLFADRFRSYTYSASATTASQQVFTAGTAPVAGYEGTFFGRVVSTNNGAYFSYNGIENVRTYAGQTVTLSYWAKSASAQTLSEVAVVQYFGPSGSASVNALNTTQAITTSWVRYSHTFTMPSISGKTITSNDAIYINIKGAINNALDMWGFQLEAGSIATPFQTASGGSIQGELAMCQRYYFRFTGPDVYSTYGIGYYTTTTAGIIDMPHPVPLRTKAASVDFGNVAIQNASAAIAGITGLTISQGSLKETNLDFTVGSGGTLGQACRFLNNANAAGFIGLSAEL